ncbi:MULTISPECIES: DEAD/DEAH box helicase [unclassified Chelatococcus]|uniref:DEAD/DEAH box helicase n=1 Tax=unclassified Chelatococcus TaxID=2638111 RepID=UPI001BD10CE6|nr:MULTISPECIES: DEAD/DEAH box helicase [unclassified Chelatococcus]CAH1656518.1 ATP-dependent RNA helicase DeaD [Hyphomicrobiales bacterium]MBS7742442.1 DEAD/DEAH box helicase [Chelatococcus sp. HY11]MBX3542440.1 DEAD/DEAH box helicase [Chelatococcus sp.]MCO5075343.1 DEAD/DEAH box helicase [Chelatococcus sp.]CAH1695864.1 ATP-dependent RNA helicase DeaD [Hyphomicrobiales bacterium]
MTTTDDQASLPTTIHPALASALEARGYSRLTPVQMVMVTGDHGDADLLVSAQTGSGKTVAFGIAIASTMLGDADHFEPAGRPLGLIIAPTRELAIQVQRELDWLYGEARIKTATCVGGMDMRNERRALERGAHLVVGTPGRLRDHITKGVLDLSALRVVVLDEADEMLDLGFREDLEFILGAAPGGRRTLLFSATVPRGIAELAKTFQKDAVRIAATASTEQHTDIEYQLVLVRREEREHAVINTLLESDSASALVFCHTREAVRHLTARLANRGFSVVSLSGEMAQSERSSALQSMRDGRAHVCVATDVAARGIDLPNLDLVIHADVPSNPATLLHRSGRTGRAGRKGVCVLIVPENRRGAAQRVLALARLTATTRAAPGIAEIEARYRRQILDTAVSAAEPDEAEAAFVTELLARVTPERIAAAFLRQQLAARPVPEDLSPLPLADLQARKPRRDRIGEDRRGSAAVREPHGSETEGGVWFTLSLGRRHRADPKWLLPMICNAGGVSKRDVGSIRIDDTETRFEISPDKAAGFAEHLRRPGSLEKGVVIAPAGDVRTSRRQAKPKFRKDGKAVKKPAPHRGKAAPTDRDHARKHKGKPKRQA